MSWGKHFEAVYTGSMFGAGANTFAVWGWCIANAKPPGVVEINPKLLAAVLGMEEDEVRVVIRDLQEPDLESRTKEHDGKRLVRQGQFLYLMPSWAKWNELRNENERREANAKAAREYRRRRKGITDDAVTSGDEPSNRHASANGDVDTAPDPDGDLVGSLDPSPCKQQKGEGVRTPVPTEQPPVPTCEVPLDCGLRGEARNS